MPQFLLVSETGELTQKKSATDTPGMDLLERVAGGEVIAVKVEGKKFFKFEPTVAEWEEIEEDQE
jgi:hypothetical protein